MRKQKGITLIFPIASLMVMAPVNGQQINPDAYSRLPYRYIGPVGNRVIAVAGVTGDPSVYYVGAASGGIFKTTDGGIQWEPIFDDQPVSSIGALAVATSDPNVVWAGTGETFIRSNVSIGNGIYKSTDGGKTWQHMGLEKTGRIGRIVIHPKNFDIVYAAALGHGYGPQQERGIYRTKDGGANWERILFVDENTGVSDIVMDPNNPRILFAGMWQLEIHTWRKTSGGPGSGLWVSRDRGDTWKELTRSVEEGGAPGLPKKPIGKIGVAVAPSNSNRIYALIETSDGVPSDGHEGQSGELWRSDDGGKNWKLVNHDRNLTGRSTYYSRFAVSPDDDLEVYFLSAAFIRSLDGGETFVARNGQPGADHHDMWIDPTDGNRMIVGSDRGVAISANRGRSWRRVRLPIAQMYHVAVDNQIPYYVYGNMQDGIGMRGPSNSRQRAGYPFPGGATPYSIPTSMWQHVAGGESGWLIPNPEDPDIVWGSGFDTGSSGGIVGRYNERTRQHRRVEIWPDYVVGSPAAELKYRFNWTFPLAISPHDHNKVYAGSQYVHVTTDGGQSWQVISPDLSTNDKSKQQSSGGLTPENYGVEYCCVLFAIAESPLEEGVIWAGTNDGLVWITRDGGANWTDLAKNIPDLPPWGTVSNIEPSPHQAGKAYITVDFHQVNNRNPYVYKTIDYGRTWTKIVSGIPESPLSYAHCVREDPVRPGLLYLGTENAVYISFDDGENWLPLQNNLPHAPVHWLVVQEHFNDLVIGTYGRGFWILDDITPLQQLTPEDLGSEAHLFAPRPAYRFRAVAGPVPERVGGVTPDPAAGVDPPYGASINYYLGSVPEGDVTITVLDANGRTVSTLRGTKEPGINRVWWNLRSEPIKDIRLRTSPLYAPWVELGPMGYRYKAPGGWSFLEPPGIYTVKLTVGGREFTQQLEVKKDPHSEGSEADIHAQVALMRKILEDANRLADMINQIEWIRKQLRDLKDVLAGTNDARTIVEAADELERKLIGVEEHLLRMKMTGRGQDFLRWPPQLAEKLGYLHDQVDSDFSPTIQQAEVHRMLREQVANHRSQLDEVLGRELVAFNKLLRERNLPHIIQPGEHAARSGAQKSPQPLSHKLSQNVWGFTGVYERVDVLSP